MITNELRPVPLLFLDIDGTVRKGKEHLGRFVNGPEDVEVFDEAAGRMRQWRQLGGRIAGVSNQGGIALDIVDEDLIGAAMVETDQQVEHLFDVIRFCHHHPDGKPPYGRVCWCRKPGFGLLVGIVVELGHQYPGEYYPHEMMLFVGDRPEDKACAEAAGIGFLDAEIWRTVGYGDTLPSVEAVKGGSSS